MPPSLCNCSGTPRALATDETVSLLFPKHRWFFRTASGNIAPETLKTFYIGCIDDIKYVVMDSSERQIWERTKDSMEVDATKEYLMRTMRTIIGMINVTVYHQVCTCPNNCRQCGRLGDQRIFCKGVKGENMYFVEFGNLAAIGLSRPLFVWTNGDSRRRSFWNMLFRRNIKMKENTENGTPLLESLDTENTNDIHAAETLLLLNEPLSEQRGSCVNPEDTGGPSAAMDDFETPSAATTTLSAAVGPSAAMDDFETPSAATTTLSAAVGPSAAMDDFETPSAATTTLSAAVDPSAASDDLPSTFTAASLACAVVTSPSSISLSSSTSSEQQRLDRNNLRSTSSGGSVTSSESSIYVSMPGMSTSSYSHCQTPPPTPSGCNTTDDARKRKTPSMDSATPDHAQKAAKLYPSWMARVDSSTGMCPIHVAASNVTGKTLTRYIEEFPESVHIEDRHGNTCIYYAVKHGLVENVRHLLRTKCSISRDFNCSDDFAHMKSCELVHVAVVFGHDACVRLLVDNGAEVNGIDKTDVHRKISTVHVAAIQADFVMMKVLCDRGANMVFYNDASDGANAFECLVVSLVIAFLKAENQHPPRRSARKLLQILPDEKTVKKVLCVLLLSSLNAELDDDLERKTMLHLWDLCKKWTVSEPQYIGITRRCFSPWMRLYTDDDLQRDCREFYSHGYFVEGLQYDQNVLRSAVRAKMPALVQFLVDLGFLALSNSGENIIFAAIGMCDHEEGDERAKMCLQILEKEMTRMEIAEH